MNATPEDIITESDGNGGEPAPAQRTEIEVRLKRDRLASSRLTATDVQEALQRENVTLPGGDMREGTRDRYVRTRGEYQSLDEIAATIITVVDGKPIRVGDIAEVVDGYEDINRLVQIDGQPMVRLGVRKQSGANTVKIAREVKEAVAELKKDLPPDISINEIIDTSVFIKQSITIVFVPFLFQAKNDQEIKQFEDETLVFVSSLRVLFISYIVVAQLSA